MKNNLPILQQFKDLHLTENLKAARMTLKEIAGVYVIICTVTGTIYLGSSINIGERLMDHFIESSNIHLRNSIAKHGVENFVFGVVEFFEPDPDLPLESNKVNMLSREQVHLDWLFTLPSESRYNFLPVAGSSLGSKHTNESKTKISAARNVVEVQPIKGKTHTVETRLQMSASKKGNQNHSIAVCVYTLDNVLFKEFISKKAAAEWFSVSDTTIRNYIKTNSIFQGKYIIKDK